MNDIKVEKVFIWDSNELSPESDCTTLLWCGFSDSAIRSVVSIPQLIEENATALRTRYLAWVYELGEFNIRGRRLIEHLEMHPGFSYWWMSLFVEKCNYSKSPQIDDAIRLMAFTDWADGHELGSITLASDNEPLAECMRLWCEKALVAFEWQRTPKPVVRLSWIRRAYASLPAVIQALAWLLHYLVGRWPLRGVGLDEWKQTDGRTTFISYLFNLDSDALKAGRYESPFWAHLPDELNKDGYRTNWLHLYVKDAQLPNAEKVASAIRDLNKSGQKLQNHVVLDSFLTVRVVFRSLFEWARLAWTGKKLQRLISPTAQEKLGLWPLFLEDWRQSTYGVVAIGNSLNLNLFAEAMKSLPKQQLGVYLQENQGWEFALIHAWQAAGQGQLIGTPHSTIRFWDLRYFFDPRSYQRNANASLPLPDQVALNGKAATDAYLAGGYPAEDLVQVEALRYLYLEEAGAIAPLVVNSSNPKNRLRLLVLGEYLERNTRMQMLLLEQAARLLPVGTLITVKPHPSCPIRAEDYPGLRMTIVVEPVKILLEECDVAYCSAVTSAAVDAYCAGVTVVSVLDSTALNLSPLRGFSGAYYASTSNELAQILLSIVSVPRGTAAKQAFFTIDRDLPRWRKLLISAN